MLVALMILMVTLLAEKLLTKKQTLTLNTTETSLGWAVVLGLSIFSTTEYATESWHFVLGDFTAPVSPDSGVGGYGLWFFVIVGGIFNNFERRFLVEILRNS